MQTNPDGMANRQPPEVIMVPWCKAKTFESAVRGSKNSRDEMGVEKFKSIYYRVTQLIESDYSKYHLLFAHYVIHQI